MAEWKKIVVSGSAISQLNNDSNYLVAGDSVSSLSGSFSGSFEGDGSGITGITADTLGNSIVDGNGIADFTFNGSAGATVSVEADGSTLSVGASGVKVADAGITATQLNASVAGDGLAGGAGTALSVTVDDSTIEIDSDSLRVKSTFSSSLDSRISANASAISSNDTDIANLTAATSSYATTTSQTNLSSSLAGRISNQEAFSSSLDATFATDADLTSLSSSLAARDAVNEGDIDTLQAVQGALVAATASYAAQSSVDTNSTNISSLQDVQGALVAATASYASATSVTNASSSLAASITTNATAISGNDTDISALQGVQGALVAATASYAAASELTSVSSSLAADKQDSISVSDTSGQGGIDLTFSSDTLSGTVVGLGQSDSPTFAGLSVTGNTTIDGNFTVNGTASYVNTQDLFVEDRFILLNSGSANPDEGGIVIDEGGAEGHAYFYDSNNVRFGFTSSLDATTTGGATPDAFAAAVVDEAAGHSDVAEYQKNGNIRVTSGGDIFIYA